LQENIAGARVVKAFARAAHEERRFEATNEEYTDHSVRVTRFMSTMSPILTIFVNIGMVVVIWSGGLDAINGQLTVGQIVAFTNYLLTTMTPLIMMTMLSQAWSAGFASTARIREVLDAEPDVQDAPDARPLHPTAEPQVRLERVGFRYGAGSRPVLQDINLLGEPGQTVAILGATGSGKSTLVNLIPRFYDAETGRVLIDRVDARDLQQRSLHAAVGIAPQESVLFSGTVADNIRYGRPEATDEEVIFAAKAAQAHGFISEMPEGYDSLVAARGANLSGGQKQRLAIARALLTRPKILILDDATSAVDVETETKIQDALARGMEGGPAPAHTTFVVAQRISTVLKADKIIVLDRGHIVAEGTHAELLAGSPIYREIYDSQLGGGLLNGDEGAGLDGERRPE
jgi:ATP-binding cassette subfamily B protein